MECLTRTIWEFDSGASVVKIYHYGKHSCQVKPERNKEMQRMVINQFKENNQLRPSQVPSVNINKAVQNGNWKEVERLSEALGTHSTPET